MNSTGSTRRNRQIRFDGLPVKTNKEQIERKHAMTSQEYCKIAVAALEDRKAEDVKIIDIREISPVADYFVIADGTNQNQIQAMRDACEEALYKAGLKTKQIEGNSSSTWILMDYGDIIVHLFSKEDRLFYDLERIWRDGKIVDVADL